MMSTQTGRTARQTKLIYKNNNTSLLFSSYFKFLFTGNVCKELPLRCILRNILTIKITRHGHRGKYKLYNNNDIFPQIDGKFPVNKKMNWKINTNRRYTLNPANRRKTNVYTPKNIIPPMATKNSANRREFSSSQK